MTRNNSSAIVLTGVIYLLNRKTSEKNSGDGLLPARAPLANPYVPFQIEEPAKYEPRQGMVRGTLFPGLDLPFMGMVNKNELPITPLTELQTLAFGIQELALYLDTHANDTEALELYRAYQKMYEDGKNKYEQMCGPLNHLAASEGPYKWLSGPWPWEYIKNREV